MSGFQSPITIFNALEYVKRNNYLLPAFQREYVWKEFQIENLFDSLMRGYPISSMLFWKVSGAAKGSWKFYRFLNSFVERHKIHNEVVETASSNDFFAILDGQQRLTSLNIGLYGTYASHEYKKSWDYSPTSFPEKRLYLCLKKNDEIEENSKTYVFEFKKSWTNDLEIDSYNNKWFRVGKIVDLHVGGTFFDFILENQFCKDERDILTLLEKVIFTNLTINYYEEDDANPDKAVNIFTRINSGGTALTFPMILFSLMVANWTKDARTEISNLVDNVGQKGFSISTDYVIKAFLFLHHKSIKSQINSFNKDFCSVIEANWENIRDSIYSLFDLLKSFGLDIYTLTSTNATMPILYYIYHKGVFKDFKDKVEYKEDREIIKNWLYKVLLRRAYGKSSDSALTKTRTAFTGEFEKDGNYTYIEYSSSLFPAEEIMKKLGIGAIDDESIGQILSIQKDNQYCFPVLALLYPALDYKNNNFHKDHMHPKTKYDMLSDSLKEKYPFEVYNSILNLQMLDANENESKNQKDLDEWVNESIAANPNSRKQFLESHIIPDVDLQLSNFEEFIENRRILLTEKLKQLL